MSTRLTTTDLDLEVYDRQRATRRLVTAYRNLTPPEDTVIAVANLTPDGAHIVELTPAEQAIAAGFERISDAAIRQIRAEHERVRAAMRGGRR